jgi:hypothetical protein
MEDPILSLTQKRSQVRVLFRPLRVPVVAPLASITAGRGGMRRRGRVVSLVCLMLLSACVFPTGGIEPTSRVSTAIFSPAATLALPPRYTATPTSTPLPKPPPLPEFNGDAQNSALLPEFAADLDALPDATRYSIEINVVMDSEESRADISGVVGIRFFNPGPESLSDVVLMLWPNDAQYQGGMVTEAIFVDSVYVEPSVELDGIALRLRLPRRLPVGEAVEIMATYTLEVDLMRMDAPRRMGITHGVLLCPTCYPLVPRILDGAWQVEAAPPGGDTTNSDIALYSVTFDVPAAYDLIASGTMVSQEVGDDGGQRVVFVSGPMRDFVFALGEFETKSRVVQDTILNAWILQEHSDDTSVVLNAAAGQFEILSELVGPYPYSELDIVDAPGAFGGIEYPGLVFVGTVGTNWIVDPTVHEVAHQWFYGLIGDDQLREPWLDEALATYSQALYLERTYGVGRATGFFSTLRALLRDHPASKTPIGLSVGEYASEDDYGVLVYYKGALFVDALRRELGDREFNRFLQEYFQRYRYGFVSAEDFQDLAEEICACDLDDLFDLWVYEGGDFLEP